jgi:hypothetical protein
VPLGIYGYAGGFTEIQIVGKLEKIWCGVVGNLWDRLLTESERWNCQAKQKNKRTAFHQSLLTQFAGARGNGSKLS